MDKSIAVGPLAQSILKTLVYFDLFDYPLTPKEVFTHLPTNHVTENDVKCELDQLTRQSLVFQVGSFYSLQNNPSLETRRVAGNNLAKEYLNMATRRSALIASFPFVEAVMVSGSLSKGYADAGSDVDFFIVTKPGRLFIARTLLVLYKRLFLFNSHKYFCVNYFVSADDLRIPEQNIFTATELVTLLPMRGREAYCRLLESNSWVTSYFPNYTLPRPDTLSCTETPSPYWKKLVERLINLFMPDSLDRVLMRLTLNRWKRLYRNFSPDDFDQAFKTNRQTSKGHQHNYQKKIVAQYEERLKLFLKHQVISPAA